MRSNIYVISGLGADSSVFCRLNLPGYKLCHVEWVETKKGETMQEYAKRLLPQIKEENPIVMGLSLGGMLALEVSKLIPVKKVISLSSVVSYHELPLAYKLAGILRLQRILPVHWFAKGNKFTQWIFGVHTAEDRVILNQVFKNLDRSFLYWALNAVLTWENRKLPKNLLRIHGSSDMILPRKRKSQYDVVISKGTHLMLLDQHKDVSAAILSVLK